MRLLLFLVFLLSTNSIQAKNSKEGLLTIEYGDSHDSRGIVVVRYYLETEFNRIQLDMSEEFINSQSIIQWTGKHVRVNFAEQLLPASSNKVQFIELLEGKKASLISGAQPWVSILCKFSDKAAEPKSLAFFDGMYANIAGGLDHYWREVSYNNINIVGSKAFDWVNLPSTHATYVPTPGSNTDADRTALFMDCTSVVDSIVDFSDIGDGSTSFVGINMMFNDVLDCCAWGGTRFATLDGVSKVWRVTWEPPWSYKDEGIIAHEMGHGFGLPHSNNSDEDTDPYDSPWDVMSAAHGYTVIDPVYGRLGKHINMHFKKQLDWVSDVDDGFIADTNTDDTITIDNTTLLATVNYKFARIPLSDSSYYVVEARKKIGNYEAGLPGTAIIIHHVIEGRSQPPWIVDKADPPADYSNNEGVMWKVGETFTDAIDGYTVEVLAITVNGFSVHIKALPDALFANSFENL